MSITKIIVVWFVLMIAGASALHAFGIVDMRALLSKKEVIEIPKAYGEVGSLNTWPGETQENIISEYLTAKNYYLVIDGSGSMWNEGCSDGERKMRVAKDAVMRFIDKTNADDNLGLLTFDHRGMDERVSLGRDQQQDVKVAVEKMSVSGATPLAEAVESGRDALTAQAKKQLGYGEYNLVIVTDGEASEPALLQSEMDVLLRDTPIVVHTIGFCIDSDHTLNQPGYTVYKAANNPEALDEALTAVLAEAPSFEVNRFN